MSELKIPVVSAKAIAQESDLDAVVVVGFRDGVFCVTSYGRDRVLCRAAKSINEDVADLLMSGGLWVPHALQKGGRLSDVEG